MKTAKRKTTRLLVDLDTKAFFVAARKGDVTTIRNYLQLGTPVDVRIPKAMVRELDPARQTALMIASGKGNKAVVKLLLDQGADPNAVDEYKRTALVRAVDAKHTDVVRLLLTAGADPNQEFYRGDSILRLAATARMPLQVFKLLLSYGANVHAHYNGGTALHVAAYHDRVDVAKLLVKAGANIDGPKDLIGSPLCAAIAHKRSRMIRFLLDEDIDPTRQPEALGLAAWDGQLKTVRLLLEHGFDPNTRTFRGITPLRHARNRRHRKIIDVLIDAGAK